MSPAALVKQAWSRRRHIAWRGYLISTAIVAVCSLGGWVAHLLGLANTNVVMIFLAGVALIAARLGRGPAIFSAILSVLVFDFFLVDPVFTFARSDTQYIVTLLAMLGIGILISELTSRLQSQLRSARDQQHRTDQLYQMTRQLSELAGSDSLLAAAVHHLSKIFLAKITVHVCENPRGLDIDTFAIDPASINAVLWVAEHGKPAGLGSNYFSGENARFAPMIGSQRIIGVLCVQPQDLNYFADPEQQRMLETCASLVALSIERDQSFLAAHDAHSLVEAEQLRNYLLSSVSHDLRTPLATIAVTTSSLLDESNSQNWPEKRDMLQTVVDESHRLGRQVENLLGHARLTSGVIELNREWQVLEELVGIALARLQRELEGRPVRVHIDNDFPLLWVAGDLIERVFLNLLENAIRYTPPGTEIEITAIRSPQNIEIRFGDRGPGLPPENTLKVFDKFFRGTTVADGQRGIGLGLAICKAIVEAHNGIISAANRPGGGAEFTISLPCPQRSPQATLDDVYVPTGS